MSSLFQLTPRQAALIAALEFSPDLTLSRLAKAVSSRPSTVGYTLERMFESGLVKQRALIDFFKLGYGGHLIYFSLSATKKTNREAFVADLTKRNGVAWFGNLVGRFEYGLTLLSKNVGEVSDLLHSLAERHKVELRGKIVASRSAIHYYGRRYIGRQNINRKPIVLRWNSEQHEELDKTDKDILRAISQSIPRTTRDIARNVGGNFSLIDRRLQQLLKRKVLAAKVLEINTELLGRSSYRLLISSRSLGLPLKQEIFAFAAKVPEVIMVLEAYGTWEYEIDVEVTQMKQLIAIVQKLSDHCAEWISEVEVLGENEDYRFSFYPF